MFSSVRQGNEDAAPRTSGHIARESRRVNGLSCHRAANAITEAMALALSLAIIAFAAAFHLYWAFGGRLGYSVSLPQQPDGRPVMHHRLPWWRPAALGVAIALAVLAAILLTHAGRGTSPLPDGLTRLALMAVGIAFVARALVPNRYVGFFKFLRTTRWARYDTRLYSPLFLILGLLILAQAL